MMRRLAILALCAALSACGPSAQVLKANAEAAEAFMAKNAKEPGIVVLPSGLQYKIVRSGPAGGDQPKRADEIKIHYEGKLAADGKVFDSSYERGAPAIFPLAGLIPAWVEALPLMRPGDEWMLYVPPALGYGENGAGSHIPPNSALIFRIELLGILPHPEIGVG